MISLSQNKQFFIFFTIQKLRIVSPVSRPNENFETNELCGRMQDMNSSLVGKSQKNIQDNYQYEMQGSIFTSIYQKIHDSPEILADFTSLYTNNFESQSKNFGHGKRSEDHQSNNILISSNFYDNQMRDNFNMSIDEENMQLGGLASFQKGQYQINDKNKNISKLLQESNNNHNTINNGGGSGNKKNNQLSPNQKKQMLSMSKIIKNSSVQKEQQPEGKPIKSRRKKSQGKINVNLQNLNNEDCMKNQQMQMMRSSSQPQGRCLSQNANSQERLVLQLKKNSIKSPGDPSTILLKQDIQRCLQLENSIERTNNGQVICGNASNKQGGGNIKVLLKKSGSIKQISTQQALKISKDQIINPTLVIKQQNYNSNGSNGNVQQQQQQQNHPALNTRSRSLSNSKLLKKKQQTQGQDGVLSGDEMQNTQRASSKDKNTVGNSFNQSINNPGPSQQKGRCKSNNKVSMQNCLEEQQPTQAAQITQQNSSKILMFKTNNEESNAKVAALKSIIKLSSNTNTNYMQQKQSQVNRNHSKENIQNQSQTQAQNALQYKQVAQKFKLNDAGQGQFVQKCASASQNTKKPPQQTQQYMQRISSSRITTQQNVNYHNQIKVGKDGQVLGSQDLNIKTPIQIQENLQSQQFKINLNSGNSSNNVISQDNKDNSSSLKLGTGQVNIRNIKVNNQQFQKMQDQQQQQQTQDPTNSANIASTNRAQIAHQQKMHQILMTQQNKNQNQQNYTQLLSKQRISRNAINLVATCEDGSGSSMNKKQQDGNKANLQIQQNNNFVNNVGVYNQNESFRGTESNGVRDQFSRKNSTLSNGSIQTQINTLQKEQFLGSNFKSENQTQKNHSKDLISRMQNTSQITYNTGLQESNKPSSKNLQQTNTISSNQQKRLSQISDEKKGKKLNFYNQMSPTSDILSQLKDSQMISAFKNSEDDFCLEDESIVIIQEDQLRIPLRSSKQSQQQSEKVFLFDQPTLQKHEQQQIHQQIQQIQNNINPTESYDSDLSVFKKKHETSVIEQESLVTQIKTQLMKIHFQQAFQGEIKQKRRRNTNGKDCQTMREGGNKIFPTDIDHSSKQSLQGSGTFYFEPQFDDLSFEIDTCNQIRVPKNLNQPINQARVMSLPDDYEIYQEFFDPITGKVKFQLDQKTVTILNQRVRKNIILKPENIIIQKSVQDFKDPLFGRLKSDYESHHEEKQDEEIIEREIETTMNFIPNCNNNTNTNQSQTFRESLCSSNNYSLNTFLSEEVSINSNLFSQALQHQGSQIANGIMNYATEKLGVREGDPLFLLPRLKDNFLAQLKPAILKKEPEWWFGHELATLGSTKNDIEPVLETFIF